METDKHIKRDGNSQPAVRSLKIQPRIRFNRRSSTTSPEIKLSGTWLEESGFHSGQRVLIRVMKEMLIIEVQRE